MNDNFSLADVSDNLSVNLTHLPLSLNSLYLSERFSTVGFFFFPQKFMTQNIPCITPQNLHIFVFLFKEIETVLACIDAASETMTCTVCITMVNDYRLTISLISIFKLTQFYL